MKWILPLLVFLSLKSFGQEDASRYQKYPTTYGMQLPRIDVTGVLRIPDTSRVGATPGAIGKSPDGTKIFIWTGIAWILQGSANVDSTVFTTTKRLKDTTAILRSIINSNAVTPWSGNTDKIVTWGNSLTAGQPDAQYPSKLGVLVGKQIYNGGVGGQTSTQIAVRQGGIVPTITIVGGSIPASGGVNITFPAGYEPITYQGPVGGIYGTINGVYGLLTWIDNNTSAGISTFTRAVDGSSVSVSTSQFLIDNGNLNTYPTIFELGRNNLTDTTQVLSDIAAAVAHLGHNRYLVLGVINAQSEKNDNFNGVYAKVIALNAALLRIYGPRFVDYRSYIISKYNPAISQDVTDHSQDVEPTSLSYDGLHYNNAGYGWEAELLSHQQYQDILFPPASIQSSAAVVTAATINNVLTKPIVGNANIQSFTSTNKAINNLGLTVEGGLSNNDYGGIDFRNRFRGSTPLGRIGMLSADDGSYLNFGTSNDWRNGITNRGLSIDPKGWVAVAGLHKPVAPLDVYGDAIVRGNLKFINQPAPAWITAVALSTSFDNLGHVFLGGHPGEGLAPTAGATRYLFELQQGNSASNVERFQIASHRRQDGSGYVGTEFRLQYAVDQGGGTDGNLASIALGATDPINTGGSYIAARTSGKDRLTIDHLGVIRAIGDAVPFFVKPETNTVIEFEVKDYQEQVKARLGYTPQSNLSYFGNSIGPIITFNNYADPGITFTTNNITNFIGPIQANAGITIKGSGLAIQNASGTNRIGLGVDNNDLGFISNAGGQIINWTNDASNPTLYFKSLSNVNFAGAIHIAGHDTVGGNFIALGNAKFSNNVGIGTTGLASVPLEVHGDANAITLIPKTATSSYITVDDNLGAPKALFGWDQPTGHAVFNNQAGTVISIAQGVNPITSFSGNITIPNAKSSNQAVAKIQLDSLATEINKGTVASVILDYGAATQLDLTYFGVFSETLSGNTDITIINPNGRSYFELDLIQNGSSGTVTSWPTAFKWRDGAVPILSTVSGDIGVITCSAKGSYYLCGYSNYH